MDSGAGVKPDPNERSVSKFQILQSKEEDFLRLKTFSLYGIIDTALGPESLTQGPWLSQSR